MALKATLETQQTALQDLKDNKPTGSDPVDGLLLADWQEQVDILESSIRQLKQEVEKGTAELCAKDATYKELKKVELDAWANGFLNLHALRDHLLRKLHARKEELRWLDQSHGGCTIDQNLRDHVDKAVSHRSSGIEATMKKYNNRLLQLAAM